MQCKYCNYNNNDNASFCSNCGSIIEDQNSNIFAKLFKNLWRGIINPVSFIRNSKISDIATTSIILGLTMLLSLINVLLVKVKINTILQSITSIFGTIGKLFGAYGSDISSGLSSHILKFGVFIVLLPIVVVICYGLSIFAFSKINNKDSKIIEIANLVVYANFFYVLIAFLASLTMIISLTYVSVILILCGIIFFLLLLSQGVKNVIKMNNVMSLSSVFCGVLVYLVVIKVILSIMY